MKNLSLKNITSVCGGEYIGPAEMLDAEICAVTTDSRSVSSGCMFAAIPGSRVDGHDYIRSALNSGALCALVQRVPEGCTGPVIKVPSVRKALQDLAAFYRSQFDIPIIGITGSVGKTTAKEMIASVLSQRFCVHKTEGNLNNELGVPLTIFGLRPEHTAAVIEMGISDFGEMSRLAAIVRPTHALYTIIGHSHLEFLGDRRGVLKAKSEMLPFVSEKGTVFVNGDDDLLQGMVCSRKKCTFGLGKECDVRAEDIKADGNGCTQCTIVCGERKIRCSIPAYGDHMIYAALEGAAVGIALEESSEEIAAGIAQYQTVGHRGRIVKTDKYTIIDDCYNANPTSVASAIRSMGKLEGRKICILGDMLELGNDADKLHAQIGTLAAESGVSLVLTCGELSKHIAESAKGLGMHFDSRDELINSLPKLITAGDIILVKASHSMQFDKITAALESMGQNAL